MRSLASKLGVSKSTVSLALANNPRLPAATRARIQSAARAEGYTQDAVMSQLLARLRASRTVRFQGTLAVLSCRRSQPMWEAYESYRLFVSGVEARARDLGYATDRYWLHHPGVSISTLRRILRARGVQGLAVAIHDDGAPLPSSALALLDEYPSASTQPYPFGPLTHCATADNYRAVRTACVELTLRGYRRIGLYLNPLTDRFVGGRFTAPYLYHCLSTGQDPLPVVADHEPTFEHFHRWFRAHRPDALLTLVSCADRWLRELGLEPGRDVGLVHLDSREAPAWAAVDQRFFEVGAACADLVVAQIQRGERGRPLHPKVVTVDVAWREGATVRPRAAEAVA
jgi:LacI family transcriptional regulator